MFGKRALLLIPHPDDELVGMAAGIEQLRRDGGDAFAAYLTSGVPAHAGAWWNGRSKYPRRTAERWKEASDVAVALGMSIVGRLEIPSRQLKAHVATSLAWVREKAASLAPDRIWVPAYEGGHQDHDVVNFIGSQLAVDYDVWEFSEYNFAAGQVRNQSFINTNGTETTILLDESARARKQALLRCYSSEQKNLSHVGLERESFRPLSRYDYSRRPHEGRCFYERFQWFPMHPRIDYCRPDQVCETFKDFVE